jgi:hypothetical protein
VAGVDAAGNQLDRLCGTFFSFDYPRHRLLARVKADLTDHTRGPKFFTVIAGTCVLGSQLLIVAGRYQVAMVLWVLGQLLLWVIVMYAFLIAVTVRENKPLFETGISGTWLLATVATQSFPFWARCWRITLDHIASLYSSSPSVCSCSAVCSI